jgi:hypothetical protein
MQNFQKFLQGKKTYFSAIVIAIAALCGWWFGTINSTQAIAMLATAGAAAGLGAKSERAAEAVLSMLADLRKAQAVNAVGQKIDHRQIAAEVVKQLAAGFSSGGVLPARTAVAGLGNDPSPARCVFCGQPIYSNGTVCIDPRNNTEPDTVGNRHHVFTVSGTGATAK